MKNLLPLLALHFASHLCSQTLADYQPLATKPANLTAVLSRLEKRYNRDLEQLPKENRDELEAIYKERYEHITGQVEGGFFLFDKDYKAYFDSILTEITRSNPSVPARGAVKITGYSLHVPKQ